MRTIRVLGAAFGALALLAVTAQPGLAACGDNPGDLAAVQAARADVASNCPCASAANHGAHVKCAAGRANFLASDDGGNALPKNCKGVIKRCAAKSTCGKPGAVRCCTTKNGVTKCKITKDATKCTQKGGTASGTGSCCSDADPLDKTATACSPSGAFLDLDGSLF